MKLILVVVATLALVIGIPFATADGPVDAIPTISFNQTPATEAINAVASVLSCSVEYQTTKPKGLVSGTLKNVRPGRVLDLICTALEVHCEKAPGRSSIIVTLE